MTLQKIVRAFLLLTFAVITGCTSFNSKVESAKYSMKSSLNMIPATQCSAFWSPAVRHDPSLDKAQRGFGGRAYFYGSDGKTPVKVGNGHLVIYAFDETNRAYDDVKPTRTYVFPPEEVAKLYKKSKLGHSYNLWIPWDNEGAEGEAKPISLIVKFVPEAGSTIVSSQANVYLAGKVSDMMLSHKTIQKGFNNQPGRSGEIAQVSYQQGQTASDIRTNQQSTSPERIVEQSERRQLTRVTTIGRDKGTNKPYVATSTQAAKPNEQVAAVFEPVTYQPTAYYVPTDSLQNQTDGVMPAADVTAAYPSVQGAVPPVVQVSSVQALAYQNEQSTHYAPGLYPAPSQQQVPTAYAPAENGQPLLESQSLLPHQYPVLR
ncbi:MAG: hypothetical protein LBU65_09580 [Planctomycetaceae bacterium]|jgi:hypothetical protein|nr:hypothetical protein [Planctomycetaceae bacterium]